MARVRTKVVYSSSVMGKYSSSFEAVEGRRHDVLSIQGASGRQVAAVKAAWPGGFQFFADGSGKQSVEDNPNWDTDLNGDSLESVLSAHA